MPRRTALYRLYNAANEVIYIGTSYKPADRLKQHRDLKWWWPQVKRHEVIWFPDQFFAERVELEMIGIEKPIHNTTGVPGKLQGDPPMATADLIPASITEELKRAADRYREFRQAEADLDAAIIAAAKAGYRPKDIATLIGGARNMQRIGQMTKRVRDVRVSLMGDALDA